MPIDDIAYQGLSANSLTRDHVKLGVLSNFEFENNILILKICFLINSSEALQDGIRAKKLSRWLIEIE